MEANQLRPACGEEEKRILRNGRGKKEQVFVFLSVRRRTTGILFSLLLRWFTCFARAALSLYSFLSFF